MAETQSIEFTRGQIGVLQKLLQAGFQFASVEHITRHVVIEKSGFIALLDPADGKFRLFGSIGYRVGEGIGMLVEQDSRPVFVCKKEAVEATPERLAAYSRVKAELTEILGDEQTVQS